MIKNIFLLCLVFISCHREVKKTKSGAKPLVIEEILNNKITVFYFLNTECPICQKYQGSFKPIYQKYHNFFNFYYVFPGKQNAENINEFCQYDSIPFKNIILDIDFKTSANLGAEITPQVLIYNGKNLLYSGKIDDRFETISSHKPKAAINYIEKALISLLNNEAVEIKKTNPVGCFIEPD